ncbi:MarR family winged helix-turn-helix transcriptional regulator [Allorhizobium borbori]|uniref:DNA-binding MarR family transcriptional regulator n=1 Tax=Allorhizobium borbori TaxID=485907 RepID=A0A7W6P1R4_9HYPH|nr:MarR family transcriptional regulator [Allorhizobium borbori]MBB4104659.1 DNA-binding MarR family transcriptional regulator [Allorhizobium borbori]
MDQVDEILSQWHRERPDLDVGPMGLLGRLARLYSHLTRAVEKTLADYGLNAASFDVLATLRRSGAPYALSPSALMATAMVTSGTMTNRIDQLEKTGLIKRQANPDDGRSTLIALTQQGHALVEAAVSAHVANQHRLTECLSAAEKQQLNALLATFLARFES